MEFFCQIFASQRHSTYTPHGPVCNCLNEENIQNKLTAKNDWRREWTSQLLEKLHDSDSIYDINAAWKSVKQTTLVKPWRKILSSVENSLAESAEEEVPAYDLAYLPKPVTGGDNVDEDNIIEWNNCDTNDPGIEHVMNKL